MTLLEQWQARAADAERRIKEAIDVLSVKIGNEALAVLGVEIGDAEDVIENAVRILRGETPPTIADDAMDDAISHDDEDA